VTGKKISKETALEIGIKAFTYKSIVKAEFAKTIRKVIYEANGIGVTKFYAHQIPVQATTRQDVTPTLKKGRSGKF
jgi:hypothetical protein